LPYLFEKYRHYDPKHNKALAIRDDFMDYSLIAGGEVVIPAPESKIDVVEYDYGDVSV
jgi:hypothetical protein